MQGFLPVSLEFCTNQVLEFRSFSHFLFSHFRIQFRYLSSFLGHRERRMSLDQGDLSFQTLRPVGIFLPYKKEILDQLRSYRDYMNQAQGSCLSLGPLGVQ